MIFPWNIHTQPVPVVAPRLPTPVRDFVAAVAPQTPLFKVGCEKQAAKVLGPAIPPSHMTGDSGQHLAELRIRQWLIQREREALAARAMHLYPPKPGKSR